MKLAYTIAELSIVIVVFGFFFAWGLDVLGSPIAPHIRAIAIFAAPFGVMALLTVFAGNASKGEE